MSDYYPAKITIGGWGETADPRTIREYIDK